MEPGREFDAWIAEKALGITLPAWIHQEHGLLTRTSREVVPDLSTSIAAAWQVVERFNEPEMQEHRAVFHLWLNQLEVYTLPAAEAAYHICIAAKNTLDPPSMAEAFADLRRDFGKYFADIDAEKFVRDLRGDEEPPL